MRVWFLAMWPLSQQSWGNLCSIIQMWARIHSLIQSWGNGSLSFQEHYAENCWQRNFRTPSVIITELRSSLFHPHYQFRSIFVAFYPWAFCCSSCECVQNIWLFRTAWQNIWFQNAGLLMNILKYCTSSCLSFNGMLGLAEIGAYVSSLICPLQPWNAYYGSEMLDSLVLKIWFDLSRHLFISQHALKLVWKVKVAHYSTLKLPLTPQSLGKFFQVVCVKCQDISCLETTVSALPAEERIQIFICLGGSAAEMDFKVSSTQ